MTIKILDRLTIDRIAAGEVVERPAWVVKELVENALDAAASSIKVEVKGGGRTLIRVTDDGQGMNTEEAALAFERHATSKITSVADLFAIRSLGFRGEALPSIAAVAEVELLTRSEAAAGGTYLRLENGIITKQAGQARPRGTTVTVRNLFRTVPARLKFLKSEATENSRIAEVVSHYALAWPEVSLALFIDDKPSFRTQGTGNIIDTIADVYGVSTAAKMLPIELSSEHWTEDKGTASVQVSGMTGAPDISRSGRDGLSFFVNRRWINNRALVFAVEEAYRGLLMTGRHPVAVIMINVPPDQVDVNIHPAKSEVKFKNEGDVFSAVQKAVRRAILTQMEVPSVAEPMTPFTGVIWKMPETALTEDEPAKPARLLPENMSLPLITSLPVLRVIGQVMNTYIIAEGPDGVYIIDQHAAHERIRFDRLSAQQEAGQPEVQGLLQPGTLEVTPRQQAILISITEHLAGLGFTLEPFGERAWLVRTVPAHLVNGWDAALRELLEELGGEQKSRWSEKITASVACHNAIKAGQTLSMEEMRELVRQLEATPNPHTCPHGRPTIIKLEGDYLERHFGRE